MARPKGKKAVKKHVFKDPFIEEIVEMEVEVGDPLTGKLIKQKVKVKKLKKVTDNGQKSFAGISSILNDLEEDSTDAILGIEPDLGE